MCKEETLSIPWLTLLWAPVAHYTEQREKEQRGGEVRNSGWNKVRTFILAVVCFHAISEKRALRN